MTVTITGKDPPSKKKKACIITPDSKSKKKIFQNRFKSALKGNDYMLALVVQATQVANILVTFLMKPTKNGRRGLFALDEDEQRESAFIHYFKEEVAKNPDGPFATQAHIDTFMKLHDTTPGAKKDAFMHAEIGSKYPWFVAITHNVDKVCPQEIGDAMAKQLHAFSKAHPKMYTQKYAVHVNTEPKPLTDLLLDYDIVELMQIEWGDYSVEEMLKKEDVLVEWWGSIEKGTKIFNQIDDSQWLNSYEEYMEEEDTSEDEDEEKGVSALNEDHYEEEIGDSKVGAK